MVPFVTDTIYVLRTETQSYLRGYSDTPSLSGRRRSVFLATYLLAASICALVVAAIHAHEERDADARLARDGVVARGEITAVTPIYYGRSDRIAYLRVDFRFTTPTGDGRGETTDTGIGLTRDRELPDTHRPGTSLTVRYVPDAPYLVRSVSPPLRRSTPTLQKRQGVRILAIPLLPCPPRLVVWWRRRWRERHLTRNGLLLRGEIVGVRRSGWRWWRREVVTYRFQSPDGVDITAQARIKYARGPKQKMLAAVLYLHDDHFALL